MAKTMEQFFCGNIENTLLCNIILGLDQAQPHQCHTQLQRDTEACEENQRRTTQKY